MKPEYKKYILDHVNKKSIQQISQDLNLKERKIRKFLEGQQDGDGKAKKGGWVSFWNEYKLLLPIIVLGLLLNIIGITWGLPSNWHSDNKIHHIGNFLSTGDMNPHFFTNPSLNLYVQYFFTKLIMFFKGSSIFTSASLILSCRTVIAILGSITVLAVFLISRRVFNKKAGLFSALLLACTVGNVYYSHYSTPETLVTLLSTLSLFFILKSLDTHKNIDIYLAAVFFGLAFSTKFTIFPLYLFFVLAICLIQRDRRKSLTMDNNSIFLEMNPMIIQGFSVIVGVCIIAFAYAKFNEQLPAQVIDYLNGASFKSEWNAMNPEYVPLFVSKVRGLLFVTGLALAVIFPVIQQFKRIAVPINNLLFSKELFLSVVLTIVAFVAGTPFAVLDHKQLFHDLFVSWQAQYYYAGFQVSGMQFHSYLNYLINLTGWPLFVAGISGMVWAVASKSIKNKSKIFLLIGYFICMYIFLSTRSNAAQRFIFPVIPIIPVFAGFLFALEKGVNQKKIKIIVMPAIFFIIGYSFLYSSSVDLILLNDSRVQTNRWIEGNIPSDAAVGVFSYPRYLPNFNKDRKIHFLNPIVDQKSDIKQFVETFPNLGIDYLVLTDLFYNRYVLNEDSPIRKRFYESLLDEELNYKISAEFKYKTLLNPRLDFVNPKITILKNKASRF